MNKKSVVEMSHVRWSKEMIAHYQCGCAYLVDIDGYIWDQVVFCPEHRINPEPVQLELQL